ncbi:MAG: transporter, partial [Acidimicrobiales bacterium]
MRRLCVYLSVYACVSVHASVLSGQEPIRDNSFLIEEAYNQEAGVVQHINAFLRRRSGSENVYTLTQEWPLGGPRHQLSFTLPVLHLSGLTRVGDIALNYRYQLLGPGGRTAVAPRLSLFLPTGDHEQRLGSGAWGVQVNLPVSVEFGPRLVTHWNAGFFLTPSARSPAGQEATIHGYNLGASAI